MTDNFICAICRYPVEMRWNSPRRPDAIIPPLCRCCERQFSEGIGKPTAGSFRDRREVVRGFAIAEALRTEVGHQQWRHPHVYAPRL